MTIRHLSHCASLKRWRQLDRLCDCGKTPRVTMVLTRLERDFESWPAHIMPFAEWERSP